MNILLDAGAHHGSVIEAFVQRTTGAFNQIIAIEPDLSNRARLEDKLRSLLPNDPRVTVYDCALAENEGEAPFHNGLGYASQLSPIRARCGSQFVRLMRSAFLRLSSSFISKAPSLAR